MNLDARLASLDALLAENRRVQVVAMSLLPPEMPATPSELLAYAKENR